MVFIRLKKKISWLTLFFCCTVFSCVVADAGFAGISAEKIVDINDDPFAVAIGQWPFSVVLKRDISDIPAHFKALGASSTRIDFTWNDLEPQKGEYAPQGLDEIVERMGISRVDIILSFRPVSEWATEVSAPVRPGSPPRDMKEYLQALEYLVKRYKGKVKYWQIGNEPELPSFWKGGTKELVELVKASYEKIKEIDPDAQVLLAGFTGGWNESQDAPVRADFVETLLKETKGYFDILDIHLYQSIYIFEKRVQWFREKMKEYGYDRPVWSTECGGPDPRICSHYRKYTRDFLDAGGTAGGSFKDGLKVFKKKILPEIAAGDCKYLKLFYVDEYKREYDDLHAREVIKRYLMALSAGVERVYWWNLTSEGYHPIFSKMALCRKQNLQDKTPAYDAYALMTGKLKGIKRLKREVRDNVMIWEITKDDQSIVYVLWQVSGPHDFSLPQAHVKLSVPFASAIQTDVYGYVQAAGVVDGELSLGVGPGPVFIEAGQEK